MANCKSKSDIFSHQACHANPWNHGADTCCPCRFFYAFRIVTDEQLFSLLAKGGINVPRMRDFYLHSLVADRRNSEDILFTNHAGKVQKSCLFDSTKFLCKTIKRFLMEQITQIKSLGT
jgi:hypothetical protein